MRDVDPHCRIGMVHLLGYPRQRAEDRVTWVASMPPGTIYHSGRYSASYVYHISDDGKYVEQIERPSWAKEKPPRLIGDNRWLGYIITRGKR